MSPYPFHHVVTEDGQESLTVFLPDGSPIVATNEHPHFAEILEAARDPLGHDDIRELADLSTAVAQRLQPLSERVSVASGRVYFDGDEVDGSITRQIVRFLDAGLPDWMPLVRFLENLANNPSSESRVQLYDWLADRDFTITEDGHFIGYKGVRTADDGSLVSVNHGPAIVDGQPVNGAVPNAVGSTVELARSEVAFDPSVGCASGLHVGTYEYARGWACGALLTVKVNPRDVVSVPTDSAHQKVRVCRYMVLDTIDAPDTRPVVYDDDNPAYDPDQCDNEFWTD